MAIYQKLRAKEECKERLKEIGVRSGKVLLVHQGLSSLWPLEDQALTLYEALIEILGNEGTLCVLNPLLSNQEPRENMTYNHQRRLRMVQQHSTKTYRSSFQSPLFQVISKQDGRHFTNHPKYSLCCIGKYAKYFTDQTQLDFPYGEESPFESLYELKADFLMIDTVLSECEELKYADTLLKKGIVEIEGGVMESRNDRVWKQYLDFSFQPERYAKAIHEENLLRIGNLNQNMCYFSNYHNLMNRLSKIEKQ